MKKLILLIISLIFALVSFAQVKNTSIKYVSNDSTGFGILLPAPTTIIDTSQQKSYVLTAGTDSTEQTLRDTEKYQIASSSDLGKYLFIDDTLKTTSDEINLTAGTTTITGNTNFNANYTVSQVIGTGTISYVDAWTIHGTGTIFETELTSGTSFTVAGNTYTIDCLDDDVDGYTNSAMGQTFTDQSFTYTAIVYDDNDINIQGDLYVSDNITTGTEDEWGVMSYANDLQLLSRNNVIIGDYSNVNNGVYVSLNSVMDFMRLTASRMYINGSTFYPTITNLTAATTTTIYDRTLHATSGAPFTITLHDAGVNGTGQMLYFNNSSFGVLTVAGDFTTDCNINIAVMGSLIIQYNGSEWFILSQNGCTNVDCP